LKIAIVTSTRADFSIVKNLIIQLNKTKEFNLKLICTGSHLSKRHGYTVKEITKSKIKIDKKIYLSNKSDKKNIIKDGGVLSFKLSNYLIKEKISLLIILGDRFEILHSAIAAYICGVKIAHIHGGEVTHGSLDDNIRHSISKFSNLHFVSHKNYKKRLLQLGENKSNIHLVGSLGVHNISEYKFKNLDYLRQRLKINFQKKIALACIQPVTNNLSETKKIILETLAVIEKFKNVTFILTSPGVDLGSEIIKNLIKKSIKKYRNLYYFDSLGGEIFYSMMNEVDFMIGNSSSGIIEMPSFNKKTINIGTRQSGRVFADTIINTRIDRQEIATNIMKIIKDKKDIKMKKINFSNPYYKKDTIKNIIKILTKEKNKKKEIKKFIDIKF
jgi:UDP-hydrolysing UDP-N-acetyl-D-glucosamine 2-epimerase